MVLMENQSIGFARNFREYFSMTPLINQCLMKNIKRIEFCEFVYFSLLLVLLFNCVIEIITVSNNPPTILKFILVSFLCSELTQFIISG